MMNSWIIRFKRSGLAAGTILAALLLSGCFGGHDVLTYEARETVVTPPIFLAGAAGALLTNTSGFSAKLTVEPTPAPGKPHVVTGLLLGQGEQLLFSPTGGDRTFIWNVGTHRGWVLSEALQGYAPISSAEQFTNVTIISESAGPASSRVNGHPGHEAEIAVTSNLGATTKCLVWRASDLNNLPVRITIPGTNVPVIIQLANARRETLAPKLFQPPDGFTAYASADVIADEIFARKAKLRSAPLTTTPMDKIPGGPAGPAAPQTPQQRPY